MRERQFRFIKPQFCKRTVVGSALLYLAVFVTFTYLKTTRPQSLELHRVPKKKRGEKKPAKLALTSNRAVDALKCEHTWEMQFAVVVLKV